MLTAFRPGRQVGIASPRQASCFMTLLERLFVGFVVIPTTMWMALAIHYHVRGPRLRWFASLVPLVVVGVSLGLLPMGPWALAVWFGLLLVTILWWHSLRPKSFQEGLGLRLERPEISP